MVERKLDELTPDQLDNLIRYTSSVEQRQRETTARPQSHLERLLAERERAGRGNTGHNRS